MSLPLPEDKLSTSSPPNMVIEEYGGNDDSQFEAVKKDEFKGLRKSKLLFLFLDVLSAESNIKNRPELRSKQPKSTLRFVISTWCTVLY